MLSLNAELETAFGRAVLELRHIVRIRVGVRRYLTVADYTVGATDTVTVTLNGTPTTVTEGTDFTAADSDAETARAIAEALTNADAGFNAYAQDAVVTIVGPHDAATFTIASSDTSAWDESGTAFLDGVASFIDGDQVLFGYAPVIASVSPFAVELDPVERTLMKIGDVDVVFDGSGAFRNLNTLFPDLIGKVVEIRIGEASVSEVNFGPYAIAQIEDIVPSLSGEVLVKCSDVGALLATQEVRVDIVQRHPLEAIEQILIAAGVDSALYDATTLDPTQYPTIGHFVVSRHNLFNSKGSMWRKTGADARMSDPVNALDLVNGLLRLLDGSFLPDESGVYAFALYDSTATSVGAWDETIEYQQAHTALRTTTHVIVEGARRPVDDRQGLIEIEDRTASARFTSDGGSPRRRTKRLKSDWLLGLAWLSADISSSGTLLELRNVCAVGIAGTRPSSAPGVLPITQATNTSLSATRPAYFLIFDEDGNIEAVRCEAVTLNGTINRQTPQHFGGSNRGWYIADFTIASGGRGLFGTTAQYWYYRRAAGGVGGPLVYDITMAVWAAERKLARLANGMPEVDFETDHRRFAGQLSDIIALPHSRYLEPGIDGATTAELFEIVRKELKNNGIGWRVARAGTAPFLPTWTPQVPPVPNPFPTPEYISTESLQLDGSDDYVDLGSVTTLDAVTEFTISGWYRSVGSLPSNGGLLARHDSGAEQIYIEVRSGELYVEIGNATYTQVTTDTPISQDTWHFISVVYTGSALRFYIDGVHDASLSTTGTLPSSMPSGGGSNMRFGAHSDSPDGTYHACRLDNWAVFAIAATATEVDGDLYGLRAPLDLNALPSFTAPDHWWTFDNHYNDLNDGAHGTPSGGPFFHGDNAP